MWQGIVKACKILKYLESSAMYRDLLNVATGFLVCSAVFPSSQPCFDTHFLEGFQSTVDDYD